MNDSEKKRLFVAIDLPPEAKEIIYKTSNKFLEAKKNIRQVKSDNIHITLKFLGNVKKEYLPSLTTELNSCAKKTEAFKFRIKNRIDAFPNIRKASIIFVGVEEGGRKIEKIFTDIEPGLKQINISKEKRRFVPHATLARVKQKTDISELEKDIVFRKLPEVSCDRITLFESRLKPSGAEYYILEEFILGKSFKF